MAVSSDQRNPVMMPSVNGGDPRSVRSGFLQVGELIDRPRDTCTQTQAPQVGTHIDFTLQVVDRRRKPRLGRSVVLAYVSATEDGPPDGTQTVTAQTGVILSTLIAGKAFLLLTEADGTIVVRIDGASATRRLHTSVVGAVTYGASVVWP
jgi:hypothetical protein